MNLCAVVKLLPYDMLYKWQWKPNYVKVVLHKGEDNYWVAECHSLLGCISQGKTKDEAIANIREAIQGYVETLREDGLAV